MADDIGSISLPAVYTAIAGVMRDIGVEGIAKARRNQQQGYQYRGIDEVYNALAPILARHNLIIVPRVLTREKTERETKSGGVMAFVVVHAEFDIVSSIDGSRITASTYGEAQDSADKATNKAMSAAYKYMAMQTFCIPTEGDNDADAHHHEVVARQAPAPRQTSNVPGGMSAGSVGREFERNVANGSEPGLKISERAKPKSPADQEVEKRFKALEADLNTTDSKAALNAWLADNTDACAALPEPFKSDIRALVGQHFAHWKRLADEQAEREEYEARIAEEANREFAQ